MAALLDFRMPGVYTQEIPTLPPSVGVIQSAIPVFIGYTEKALKKGDDLTMKPTRVKSMKEFEDWYGGPPAVDIQVEVDASTAMPEVRVLPVTMNFKMYYSMLFYYANGGGPCFVMSVGDYTDDIDATALQSAIAPLSKVKDITILVFPDGTSLSSEAQYVGVINKAFEHCQKLKNRVVVIDVNIANDEDLDKLDTGFQQLIMNDIEFKKYGAAYYPYVDTVFTYRFDPSKKIIKTLTLNPKLTTEPTPATVTAAINARKTYADGAKVTAKSRSDLAIIELLHAELKAWKNAQAQAPTNDALIAQLKKIATDKNKTIPADVVQPIATPGTDPFPVLDTSATNHQKDIDKNAATDTANLKAYNDAVQAAKDALKKQVNFDYSDIGMDLLETVNNAVYGKIKDAITNFPVTLPPCGAIAGIYVRTDTTQGVWKAPANVTVVAGIKATIDIDDDFHASLNAPSSGKSINVIRAYPGRGLLVYGARTLAGNDLEWRYVNVRRTFCFIEDSVARAMQDFVFEPNTPQTWIKVRSMIRSFLNRLWKAGGLFGNTPEDAYEVVVSEPESMSTDDVLNGIMRVFIKVAVARPAEFIVLQYEHKFELAES